MIITQSDEKQIAPQDTTHVFYSIAPGRAPTNGSEDPNDLARHLDAHLNIEDVPPPAYDDATTIEVPESDVGAGSQVALNEPNRQPIPRNSPSFAQPGSSFASNARGLGNLYSSSQFPQGPAFQPPVKGSDSKNREDGFVLKPPHNAQQPNPYNDQRGFPGSSSSIPNVRDIHNQSSPNPRQVPQGPVFQPLVMHSKSKKLEDGFFLTPPPTDIQPHPFVQRDVTEASWTKFLTDLQTSARLSPPSSQSSPSRSGDRDSLFRSLARTMSNSGYPSGKQPEQGTRGGPGALVDDWNENFFHRRGLDVTLARGSHRLNGDRSLPPPDSSPEERNASDRSSPFVPPSFMPRMHPASPMPNMPVMPPTSPMPNMPRMPFTHPAQSWPFMPPGPMPHMPPNMPAMPHMYPAPSMPGGLMPGSQEKHGGPQRSRSRASSVSSCSSSSDSDSDPEDTRHRALTHGPNPQPNPKPQPAGSSCPISNASRGLGCSSTSDRRAMKRERRAARKICRAERRALRMERRLERKQDKFERKFAKYDSKMANRGLGSMQGDMMQGRGMPPRPGFGGPLGLVYSLATAAIAANSKSDGDEGYYRLIVADISMY